MTSLVVEATAARESTLTIRRIVLALAAIGLALRLAFALLPLSFHLIVLEDDAWMVTAIARNFALGRGISADGVNPTTGFQPLYPLTLGTLPFLAAPNALDFGFTANLLICALLSTLAIWPLWWLARRFGGEVAGLLAAALYALNPSLIRLSVNAMETSLGLLLLLALFAAYYALDLTRVRAALGLALLSALAILARLDASLAFVAIAATMALAAGRRNRVARDLRPVVVYAGATLLLLAPYFAFNYAITGRFGPSSGTALAFMQSYAGSFNLTNGLSAIFQNSAIFLDWVPSLWLKLLIVLGAVTAMALVLGRRLLPALPLLLYLPVPPLYYGYLLQQIRERYFVGFSAILIILLAWLGAELLRRRPGRGTGLALAVAASLIVALNSYEALAFYRFMRDNKELTQPTTYQAALWIRDHLPQGALIGAKNSGLYQYYSGHGVLNIDGKLNHEIVPAMEQRRLLDYLRERGVQYLVDREETMADHVAYYSHQFGPAPRHRTPTLLERIEIYGKIIGSKIGLQLPLELDRRDGWQPARPFTDAADIIQRFPRPNTGENPVVVYRLKPVGAPGVP